MVALQNGCICCTLKMDLVEQIDDIMKQERFDYIVIEASGVCEPAPIAQTICSISSMGNTYGVVAPADLSIVINKFKALGLEDIEKYLNMVRQQGFFGDFETGLIDKEEFRIRVGKEVGREVSMDECRDAYMGFFSTVPERNLELFRKLRAEGYRLSLLSNTNPFIVEWALSKEFDGHGHSLDEYLDSMYLSYELKVMKPDERIYRLMLESEKVAPSQVLFIDDGPKNIAAARQIGINVIQATNGEDWTENVLRFLA